MRRHFLAVTTMLTFVAAHASAQINPAGTFSLTPGSTFGGVGIPGPVMGKTITIPGTTAGPSLVLGASQRYDNAPLTWNGAGDYFAAAGADASTPGSCPPGACPKPGYARWNFNYFVGGANVSLYRYGLFWDTDNTVGNTNHFGFFFDVTSSSQDSFNLGMAFINTSSLPPTFNPLDAGSYTFALIAYDKNASGAPAATVGAAQLGDPNSYMGEVARVAIRVNTTVPEPATYALMAAGLAALGLVARRRRTNAFPVA